jgi:hypothetical protein
MIATRRHAFALAAGGLIAAVAARSAFAEELIIRERVMPELRVEVMGPRPHPGWSFVRGHWRWAPGGWAWVPGHWVDHEVAAMPAMIVETRPPPPSPREFWVRGHWVWEGNHWQWMRGHWAV